MNLPRPDKTFFVKPKDYFECLLMEMDAELRGMRILKYRMENHTKNIEPILNGEEHLPKNVRGLEQFHDRKQMLHENKVEKLKKISKITEMLNHVISDLKEIESQFIEYYVVFDKKDK